MQSSSIREILFQGKKFLYEKNTDKILFYMEKYASTKSLAARIEHMLYKSKNTQSGYIIQHDSSGAPYLSCNGFPQRNFHVSFSDEGLYASAVMIRSSSKSLLSGIGIDLASFSQFPPVISELDALFFTPAELEILTIISPREKQITKTIFFSLKEAALKSMADSMRPEISVNEYAYDQVDFRQFEILLSDDGAVQVLPFSHASEAARKLKIACFMGKIFSFDDYIVSIVKAISL